MTDPVPAVTEAEATGETAEIFADIRATYGVSVVNLIWRHLATFPGALPWAWWTLRPLYRSGTIAHEAAALRAARSLPLLPVVPADVYESLNLTGEDRSAIAGVLEAYERTNPMALVALSVLEHLLKGTARIGPVDDRLVMEPEAALRLPSLLPLDRMQPSTAALVLRLNRIGATRPEPVLASMYRNLAHWPCFLSLCWALLAPVEQSGGLAAAIAATRAQARRQAANAAVSPDGPTLPTDQRPIVAAAIERFTDDAICRMVVICGILRSAGPGASQGGC